MLAEIGKRYFWFKDFKKRQVEIAFPEGWGMMALEMTLCVLVLQNEQAGCSQGRHLNKPFSDFCQHCFLHQLSYFGTESIKIFLLCNVQFYILHYIRRMHLWLCSKLDLLNYFWRWIYKRVQENIPLLMLINYFPSGKNNNWATTEEINSFQYTV